MLRDFYLLYPSTALVFFSCFCLAIGSLLNVVIHRLPQMLEAEWASSCRTLLNIPSEPRTTINLFYPRSFCIHCKEMIPFYHNIPLLSYVCLRGRCHACRHPISCRYPLIEAITLALSLLAAYFFGPHLTLVFALVFIFTLICLSAIDFQHQLLPDSLTLSLLWLGLIANTQNLFTPLPNAVLSAAGGYLFLWSFIQLFYLITGKQGMGHGDFKLFAAFGAWFGWTELPLILLISSITGAIAGLLYLKTTHKTKDTPIPFGPFLCLGGLISLFYGQAIIDWYLGFYLR